jgi:hypothetical protein
MALHRDPPRVDERRFVRSPSTLDRRRRRRRPTRLYFSLARSKTGVDARRRRDATERVRLRARVVYARRRVGV